MAREGRLMRVRRPLLSANDGAGPGHRQPSSQSLQFGAVSGSSQGSEAIRLVTDTVPEARSGTVSSLTML